MLTVTFTQTRAMVSEWRHRSRSRRELAMFGAAERHDLGVRFDVNAEMHKPFWQA